MKFTTKTVVFQEMVNRVVKGTSMNKLIPLTSLMLIEVKDKRLRLVTTDASNYLYISQDMDAEDFYVVVQVDKFSKLIQKITAEELTLELQNNGLVVTAGKGTYTIELPEENGELVKYPDPLEKSFEPEEGTTQEIKLITIKTILNTNKASLAVTMEDPQYTGYYASNKIISTDGSKVCCLNIPIFNEPMLVAPEVMNLLDVMTAETIYADIKDDIVVFSSSDCTVYSHKMDGIENFAVDTINDLLEEQFNSSCKLPKNELLSVLDRISLFIDKFDEGIIRLTFTEGGLNISSNKTTGIETLAYMENNDFVPYTCQLDVKCLQDLIKSVAADSFILGYGNENTIKIVDGNVTQLLVVMDEAEE